MSLRILYILLCISALLGCNKDLVRGVKREISPVSKLAIGFVEYRKLYPTEYVDKNFRDMLQFEFLQEGYSIIEFENTKTASLKKESPNYHLKNLKVREKSLPIPMNFYPSY